MTQTQRIDAPALTTLRDGRTVTIRPLTEEDRNALLEFGQSLPEVDSLYLEDDFQNPDIITRLANAAAAENWRQFVAVAEDDTIVGYTSVRRLPGWSSHVADIHLLVDENWRRNGLGSALARQIFDAAPDLGVTKVIVEMLEKQSDGREIFYQLGFRVEGMLHNHARDRNGTLHNLLVLAYHMET